MFEKLLKPILSITLLLSMSSLSTAEETQSTTALGVKVFNDNCTRCHNARPLEDFSLSQWQLIIPHMRQRAHLTGAESKAVLAYFGSLKPQTQSGIEAAQSSTVAAESAGDATRGETVFARYGCQGCHQIEGAGGSIGPSLDRVLTRRGDAFVLAKIRNPLADNPSSAMPKLPVSEREMNDLIAYFKSTE